MTSDSFIDQELLAVDLHFGAGPFAEQHEIAGFTSSGVRAPVCSLIAPGPAR